MPSKKKPEEVLSKVFSIRLTEKDYERLYNAFEWNYEVIPAAREVILRMIEEKENNRND